MGLNKWQQTSRWFKLQRRLGLVITNSINSLLPMLFAPLVSWLVIRQTSVALWGTFVGVLITVQLGVHVVAWGNHDYLLREFSRNPAQLAQVWHNSFRSRLLLLLLLAIVGFLLYPEMSGWVLLWGLGLVLHQSCTVLITYKRDFAFTAGVEFMGLSLTAVPILFWGEAISPGLLIQLFASVTLIKASILLLRHRAIVWGGNGRFQIHYFVAALPFFLLGFGGMLNSRIDLYIVYAYLSAEDVGQYQIFTSFLLYIQALAAFIFTPFVKSLFRLQYTTIRKMSRSLFLVGLLLVPIGMAVLYVLLENLYDIHLPAPFFLLGALANLPIFYFVPMVYALYKAEKQMVVLKVNLLSIFLTLLLNIIFLPLWGLIGTVLTMVIIKWLVLLIYAQQSKIALT